jgi:hypothetical protein
MIPIWSPTAASPEFMVLEESWSISKNDLLVLTYHSSFTDFKMKIRQYLEANVSMNIRNYLIGKRS